MNILIDTQMYLHAYLNAIVFYYNYMYSGNASIRQYLVP